MAALRAQMATMGQDKMVGLDRVRNGWDVLNDDGSKTRVKGFRELVQETGAYRVEAVKAANATEQYTKALDRQKVKLHDHWKQGKLRNEVLKEQYRLQRMSVMGWREDGSGNISGDAIVPRHVPERLGSLSRSIADVKNGTASLGQVLNENRMRMGLWAQSMRSASQNLVNLGKNTQWAGRQMMMGLTLPFAALAAGTGALAYQLDKEMTRILRVYDYAAGELEGQQERIKQASMDTAKTMARTFGQAGKDTLQIAGALAAQGKTGAGLQEATAIVSRGMFLGELNQEDALKTATSILTVFRKEGETTAESNIRLADSFAYMNALENATTLSMKDMTVAIPRLSGVVKLLGGDLQDIGTMMAATSAAGVEAAQGANALKSVLFTGAGARNETRAGKTFFEATGQQIEDITNKTNGEAIPTLKAIGEAYRNTGASQVDQLRVVRDLFGIWRGGVAANVIEQLMKMEDGATNVGRAFIEAQKGAQHWHEVAQRETIALQTSASGQFKIMLESVKIELAQMGVPFLKVATQILGYVGKVLKAFNGLSDGAKEFILKLAAAVAILGPFVMILGVIGTFIGTISRFGAGIVLLASRFKLLNRDQKIAALAAGQARLGFVSETVAANGLATAIAGVNASLRTLTANSTAAALRAGANVAAASVGPRMGPALPPVITTNGRNYVRDNEGKKQRITNEQASIFARSERQERQEKDRAHTAGLVAKQREREAAAADKSAKASTRVAGATAGTVGMMAMLVGGGNKWIAILGITLMLWGSLNLAGKAMAVKQAIITAGAVAHRAALAAAIPTATRLGAVTAAAAGGSKAFAGSLLGAISPVGAIVAGLVAAGGALYYFHKKSEQAVENFEKINELSKGAADILGLAYNDDTSPIDKSNRVQEQLTLVAQLNKQYGDQIDLISKMSDEEAQQTIKRIGFEFFLATGKSEEANQVMQAIRDSAKGATSKINVAFNFTEGDMNPAIDNIKTQLDGMTSRNLGTNMWKRLWGGTKEGERFLENERYGISKKAAVIGETAGEQLAKAMNKELSTGDIKGAEDLMGNAQEVFREQAKNLLGNIDIDFDKGEKKDFQKIFGFSPDDMDKFADLILSSGGMKRLRDEFGVEFDDRELNDFVIGYRNFLQASGEGAGLSADAAKKLNALVEIVERSPGYANAATIANEGLAGSNKDMATSADIAARAARGEALALEGLSEAQKKVNDTRKGAMSEAWGTVLDEVANSVDERHETAIDSMEAAGERRIAKIEADAKVQEKAFDDRSKAQDKRHQGEEREFTSRWQTRTKEVSASYDNRVKAIEKTMEAERKAEELRQKMFEAEKNRIQRLSELYNQNVDFNVAINAGDMDEAAKIGNDMRAKQQQWALDDAAASGTDANAANEAKNQAEIESTNKARDKRMDDLKIEEDNAKLALQERQEREKEALNAEKERYKEAIEAKRASEEAKTDAQVKAAEKRYEQTKKYLDMELAAARAMTPANLAEMNTYLAGIEEKYGEHGINLNLKSKEWAAYVARAIESSSRTAQNGLLDEAKWADIGSSVGDELATGMLGMSFADFLKWMKTGELPTPPTKPASSKPQTSNAANDARHFRGQPGSEPTPKYTSTRGGQVRHSGGPIGVSGFDQRAGRPLSAGLYADEVPVIAQKGEYILQRKAVDRIGMENLHAMNRGAKGPDRTGRMHKGGVVGGMGGMLSALLQRGIAKAMMVGASRKVENIATGTSPGSIPPKALEMMQRGATVGGEGKYGSKFTFAAPGLPSTLGAGGMDPNASLPAGFLPGSYQSTRPFSYNGGTVLGDVQGLAMEFIRRLAAWSGAVGKPYQVGSGYRSMAEQQYLYNRWINRVPGQAPAAPPGSSNHNFGLASDGPHWGHLNPAKFGLRYPMSYEPWHVEPNNARGMRAGVPGLKIGGNIKYDNTIANLHKDETVLTAPLSKQLERGIGNLDSGANTTYDITMDFRGAVIREDVDIEKAVAKVLNAQESKMGRKRVIR